VATIRQRYRYPPLTCPELLNGVLLILNAGVNAARRLNSLLDLRLIVHIDAGKIRDLRVRA
jgi:hypothetical protein